MKPIRITSLLASIRRKIAGAAHFRSQELKHFTRHQKATQISYSQAGEDMVTDYLLGYKSSGFYVEVGAYHPVHLSNTQKFFKRGWSGIQVEPNPTRYEMMRRARPRTVNLNVGIGKQRQKLPFYRFEQETLCTFSAEAAKDFQKKGHKLVDVLEIEMMPLLAIFENFLEGREIDILSVDVEGLDLEVLATNDWQLYRPRLVVVETAAYSSQGLGEKQNATFDPFMAERKYVKVADTYINTIYMEATYYDSLRQA